MPRSLALRDCQLPQEQIDSVKGKSREGETPIQGTGAPSKAQIKSRKSSAVDFINTISHFFFFFFCPLLDQEMG